MKFLLAKLVNYDNHKSPEHQTTINNYKRPEHEPTMINVNHIKWGTAKSDDSEVCKLRMVDDDNIYIYMKFKELKQHLTGLVEK